MKRIFLLVCILSFLLVGNSLAESQQIPEKVFDVAKAEYTVTDQDGMIIPIDLKGISLKYIEHKAASDKFFYSYIDNDGLHVLPIKAGKAKVTLTNKLNKKDKMEISVIIAESAEYRSQNGEELPLKAYIVANESGVNGNTITGKYILLGGSGTYDYVSIRQSWIGYGGVSKPTEASENSLKIKKGKNSGTFSTFDQYEICGGTIYSRFYLIAEDSEGHTVEAKSQNVISEADIDVIFDTVRFCRPIEQGLHIKYFIKGGKEPYQSVFFFYNQDGKKQTVKASKLGEEDYLDVDIPKHSKTDRVQWLTVTDSKKVSSSRYVDFRTKEDWVFEVKVDKPIAKVGDEIHFTIINENCKKESAVKDIKFVYVDYNLETLEVIETPLQNLQKTKDGYSYICERPGEIYIDSLYFGILNGTDGNRAVIVE